MNRLRIQIMKQLDRKSHEYKALKRYWKLIQQDSRKLSHKRFYRPTFRMHLTNKEILEKLLSYSQELREHYDLYQLLLFHFQEKQAEHFFGLIEETISCINPIFQTVFKTFLKDKEKIINALPFNPLVYEAHRKQLEESDSGWQFSHTLTEQIGSQLRAGFTLTDLYEDTNGEGRLHELHIPSFIATRAVK